MKKFTQRASRNACLSRQANCLRSLIRDKKRLAMAGLFCMILTSLTGCEKVTAESLMAEAAENLKEVSSYEADMDIDMEIGVADSGISMGIGMNMAFGIEAMREPEVYHLDGSIGMDLMDLQIDMEAYGETEGNETTVYANIGGEWQKQTVDVGEAGSSGELLNLEQFAEGKELQLSEETEEDGQEVYVVTTTLDGEDFNEAMGAVSGIMDEEMTAGLDFSGMLMDVTIKIDKDTRLPQSINMAMSEESSMTVEQEGTEVSIDAMSYEIRIREYDSVETIEIPEEARNAESPETLEQGSN